MARLVIAEDQTHIRNVLMMWMTRNGHDVTGAPNGRIALEYLRTHPVDLLITDVNMPELDGIELTRQAFDACPTLRQVFVVTSRCDQHEILTELEDLRVSVFPKPFSPSQLLRAVDAFVATSGDGAGNPASVASSAGPPSPAGDRSAGPPSPAGASVCQDGGSAGASPSPPAVGEGP